MSHAYPLAPDAASALKGATLAARTRAEAEHLARGQTVVALQTDWIDMAADGVEAMLSAAEAGPGHGFVQTYENLDGKPTLAVTYWKLEPSVIVPQAPVERAPDPEPEDETDDLYFKQKSSKRRTKGPDPNQLDLFS